MDIGDMILVSVDDHVVEPPSMHEFFRDHLPAKFKDRAPRVIRRENGTDAWLVEGVEIGTFGLNAVAGRIPEEWGYDPATFDQVRPGAYDVHERVRDMNVNGVLASLNFPSWPGNGGQFFTQSDDDEFVAAMIRAYNDWHIFEWAGAYPGRFIPLALSGFKLGGEWMAGEIKRVAELGCHAISWHSEPFRFGMPDYHGDEWDAALAASQECESVVVFHFGGAPTRMPRSPFEVITHAMPFSTAIFASELLWSPMMRKFPRLRFALAEGGVGWYAYWLEKADFVYEHHHRWTGTDFGNERPSEVFRSRVLTCFIDDVTGIELRYKIGIDNLSWECDYPHSDATWPQSAEVLMKSFVTADVPNNEIDQISWQNACAFYNFDPFATRTRDECTVAALRALSPDVDTTPRRYGPPPNESDIEAAKHTHFADPPVRENKD
jgi:predicted TIM-barrel fold metal-dependent hydrolase